MQEPRPRPTRARRESRLYVKCPHCDAPAAGRSSVQVGRYLREIYYLCSNLFCGCCFVATLEIARIVTPSQSPRPDVHLPMLERGSHRPVLPANDTEPPPEIINTG